MRDVISGCACFVCIVKNGGDDGGEHWLVRMEWCPAGWSVYLPLLIFPCTIKSRSSLLAPAHPGGPGKKGRKTVVSVCVCNLSKYDQNVTTTGIHLQSTLNIQQAVPLFVFLVWCHHLQLARSKQIIGCTLWDAFFSKILLFCDVPQYSNRFDYIKDRRTIYFNNQKKSLHIIFSIQRTARRVTFHAECSSNWWEMLTLRPTVFLRKILSSSLGQFAKFHDFPQENLQNSTTHHVQTLKAGFTFSYFN